MGKSQRDKGARFEREVANRLREVWPDAKRGVGQSQSGGNTADVEGTPLWVECKVGQRPNIQAAYQQGLDATDGRPVVVASKRDRGPVLVTMGLGDWMRMADASDDYRATPVAVTHVTPRSWHTWTPRCATGECEECRSD